MSLKSLPLIPENAVTLFSSKFCKRTTSLYSYANESHFNDKKLGEQA